MGSATPLPPRQEVSKAGRSVCKPPACRFDACLSCLWGGRRAKATASWHPRSAFKRCRSSVMARIPEGGDSGSCSTLAACHTTEEFFSKSLNLIHPFETYEFVDDNSRLNVFESLTQGMSVSAKKRLFGKSACPNEERVAGGRGPIPR